MDGKNNGSFWPSYVDVMTTLFAITLVLFAVSYSKFKYKQNQLQDLVDEYENIVNVYSTVNEIDTTEYFSYNSMYLKHLMTIDINYQEGKFYMNQLEKDLTDPSKAEKIRNDIKNAGKKIKEKIEILQNSIPDSMKTNIKFLVIIEGQSSKTPYDRSEFENNYTLSYLRAKALMEFWKSNDIDFVDMNLCELLIAGSGEQGVPRFFYKGEGDKISQDPEKEKFKNFEEVKKYATPKEYQEWRDVEGQNQRFLVNIVPVIGKINVTKEKIDNLKR